MTENNNQVSENGFSSPGSETAPLETVCDTCVKDNLLKAVSIRKCFRCKEPFCLHFASKINSLQYCVSCLSDIEQSVEEVVNIKTHTHYDEITDQMRTYNRKSIGKRYTMSGDDWMFAQRTVPELSDAEQEVAIGFHRAYLSLLLTDQESRKVKKAHSENAVKLRGTATQVTTTETVVKKTTVTKLNKKAEQAAALVASMLASGMSLDALQQNLKGK